MWRGATLVHATRCEIRNRVDSYNHYLYRKDHGFGHNRTSLRSYPHHATMMPSMLLQTDSQRWPTSSLVRPLALRSSLQSCTFVMSGPYMVFRSSTTPIAVPNSRHLTCAICTRTWVSSRSCLRLITPSHRDKLSPTTSGWKPTCVSS